MLKSMTGFGRAKAVYGGREITAEIRAVNHRYLDLNVKLPRVYGFLEDVLKKQASAATTRGKADIYLSINETEDGSVRISPNFPVIEGYISALTEITNRYFENKPALWECTTPIELMRLPEAISLSHDEPDTAELTRQVSEVFAAAITEFDNMRSAEGARLCEDILARGEYIAEKVSEIEARSPSTVEEYRQRIAQRMTELLGQDEYASQRILAEAAVFADKVNVTEEIVRLRSHLSQLRKMMKSSVPSGRKLDFLVQEINREINTIGSKANDYTIAQTVVDMKAEVEKIREQIQNLE